MLITPSYEEETAQKLLKIRQGGEENHNQGTADYGLDMSVAQRRWQALEVSKSSFFLTS